MKTISDIEFVKLWEAAVNRHEVALKCSMTDAAVGQRAAKLRNSGVKLKKFQRGRHKKDVDVENLNYVIGESTT